MDQDDRDTLARAVRILKGSPVAAEHGIAADLSELLDARPEDEVKLAKAFPRIHELVLLDVAKRSESQAADLRRALDIIANARPKSTRRAKRSD